jgi:galactose mutarotase-like enzyme
MTNPPPWNNMISNPAQLGGIETSVLDNGPGRGTRIAWVNTGSGLRFKIVIDRAMDIVDAFFNAHSLAFISHLGVSAPQPFARHGLEWLSTFGGGLMTTCGLHHVGPPEEDRGLHGLVSNQPAEIELIRQPNPRQGDLEMSITGLVRETQLFGPSLELRRSISATLGKAEIRVHDEVTNVGNTRTPHMILYHCNFGWPLVEEGARILWKGPWEAGSEESRHLFSASNDYHTCPAPLDEHNAGGEAVAFIDPQADEAGHCRCGIYNERLRLALKLEFNKSQLPLLNNWLHWGKNEYVTGLEPATNRPVGQSRARDEGKLIYLEPGETRKYDLSFEVLTEGTGLAEFVNQHNL